MVFLFVLLVAGAVLLYLYLHRSPSDKTPKGVDSASESLQKSDGAQAQNLKDNPSSKDQPTSTDKPTEPAKGTETSKQQVQMTASTNTSGGIVYIRGGVNYPVSDGSCYALLVGPSDRTIRKDTTILQNPASTDCKTISIPASELSPGKWTFTLYYESGDYEGKSNEVSFSI